MIQATRRLGGAGAVCRVLSGQRYPGLSLAEGLDRVVPCIEAALVVAREARASSSGWKTITRTASGPTPSSPRSADVFLALLDAIPDRDHFGVQFDPSNALVAGDDPVELLGLRSPTGS